MHQNRERPFIASKKNNSRDRLLMHTKSNNRERPLTHQKNPKNNRERPLMHQKKITTGSDHLGIKNKKKQ